MNVSVGEAADVVTDALVLLERVVDAWRGPQQNQVTVLILEDGGEASWQFTLTIEGAKS